MTNGNFEEEYNRLLAQGFDEYIESLRILLNTPSDGDIKGFIQLKATLLSKVFQGEATAPLPPSDSENCDHYDASVGERISCMQAEVFYRLEEYFEGFAAKQKLEELIPLDAAVEAFLLALGVIDAHDPNAKPENIYDLLILICSLDVAISIWKP